MIAGETKEPALIAALVRAPDGVRFAATGGWASDVVPALAHYVGHRCQNVLWPSAAAEVRLLIDAGRPSRAIAVYFEHVGARWDEECLELYVVTPEPPPGRVCLGYFRTVAPTSCPIAPSVVCADVRPSMKSLSVNVVSTSVG